MLIAGTTQAYAWGASNIKFVIGDVVYGNQAGVWKTNQQLFHHQTLAASDNEAFAISFPDVSTENKIGALALAGPTIAQTSDAAVVSTDTGFFQANWCFNDFTNNGGFIVGAAGGMIPPISGPMLGSGLIWPYMISPEEVAGPTTMRFKPYTNSSSGLGNVTISPESGMINNTVANTSAPGAAVANNTTAGSSKKPLNYKTATKDEIQSASGMEKLYRNAKVKSPLPQSYKGTIERPTWINPNSSVIKMTNQSKAISDSMKMTNPGTKLHTLHWRL
ncbi:hypothetical protein [Methanocella arvoryzae]|nr:hypothetical protein [Methanocella arvoryzae]